MCLIGYYEKEEKRVRDWMRATRPQWERGVGVGLARTDPPEPLGEPGLYHKPFRRLPNTDEGPGLFVRGDYKKHFELVREWQLGRKETLCASTQDTINRYAELHHKVRLFSKVNYTFLLTESNGRRSRARCHLVSSNTYVPARRSAAASRTACSGRFRRSCTPS